MAEINPSSPTGGVPPKPAEAAKVQPKKETVRINLPPKPASPATIKLPSLPPGGAPPAAVTTTAATAASAPVAAAAPTVAAPARPTPAPAPAPAAAAPRVAAAVPAAKAAAAPAPMARPSHGVVRAGVSGLDVGLAVVAAIVALGAVASIALLLQLKCPRVTHLGKNFYAVWFTMSAPIIVTLTDTD